jgi:hypothetical protein
VNRRGFLLRAASLLPVPAFVRAASLWLPPERPFVVPDTRIFIHRSPYFRDDAPWGIGRPDGEDYHVWLPKDAFLKMRGSDLPGSTVFVDDECWKTLVEEGE